VPLRAEFPELLGVRGLPISFDIRIGIAIGEALVGSIGSELMMSYTVMRHRKSGVSPGGSQ
jgi:class 3 adenylate cyclase